MKNLVGFFVYLVALMTYVVLNKDFKFLLIMGGVFIAVATATTVCLWIYDHYHLSSLLRRRFGRRWSGEILAEPQKKRHCQVKPEGDGWI